ncbi:MAG: signal peptidase I [Clostridia bacterium]|nr:signal peptidase I [Clostridia bacterium]
MAIALYKKQKPLYKDPLVIIIIVLAFLLVCRILFAVNYRGVVVDGRSMQPTLEDGDYLYISLNAEPDYGDIVVLEKDNGDKIIKRVIAMGGDSVYMQNGTVYVMYSDATEYVALTEDYVAEENNSPYNADNTLSTVYVPEGYLFVLGDNRDNSNDSRFYGCFKLSALTGVVTDWSLKYKSFFTAIHF